MGRFQKWNLWFTDHPDDFDSYIIGSTESQGATVQGMLWQC